MASPSVKAKSPSSSLSRGGAVVRSSPGAAHSSPSPSTTHPPPPPPVPTTVGGVRDELAAIRALISQSGIPAKVKAAIDAKLAEADGLINHRPVTLADVGALETLKEAAETEANRFGVDETFIDVEKGFTPDERDTLLKDWRHMMWLARNDMSEEEMLVLTEPTFVHLAEGYRHPHVADVTRYWSYLVRLRNEQKAIQAACGKGVESPKERNAGALAAAKAHASQRTEALPGGIEAGQYKPEVYSPTSALWMSPSERAASTRRSGSERATSAIGSRKSPKSATGGGRAQSPSSGSPKGGAAQTTADGSMRRQSSLRLSTSGNGFSTSGPGFVNSKGWNRF